MGEMLNVNAPTKQEIENKKDSEAGLSVFIVIVAISIILSLGLLKLNSVFASLPYNNETTYIQVINTTDKPVDVYLTLGSDSGYVKSVNGIFGISDTGLQGMFTIPAFDSVLFESADAIQGNICFGAPPINCPIGNNLFEFAINNGAFGKAQQETFDISCVAGVNSLGSVYFKGGELPWNAGTGHDSITYIYNDTLLANTGLVGVYPYGCDKCITSSNKRPKCITKSAQPQSAKICNIQRNARKGSGGVIKIVLDSLLKK